MKNLEELGEEELLPELKKAIARIADMDEGLLLFQYLHKVCGYDDHSMRLDATQKVDLDSTLQSEARRSLYVEFRRLIPRKRVIHVELPELKPVTPTPIQKAKPRKRGLIDDAT